MYEGAGVQIQIFSVTWLGGLYWHHHNLGRDAVRRGSQEALALWPLLYGGEWEQDKPLQAQKFNCADVDVTRGKEWHSDCRRGLYSQKWF